MNKHISFLATNLLLFIVSSPCFASDAKKEKAYELIDMLGIVEAQLESNNFFEQNQKEYVEYLVSATKEKYPHLVANKQKKVIDILESKWNKAIATMLASKTLVDYYMELYTSKFTENELDQLITFYSSSLGKKKIKLSNKVSSDYEMYFNELWFNSYKSSVNEYWEEIEALDKE